MRDRETSKRYVSGNWIRVKTSKGHDCSGVIGCIGTKNLYLCISPIGTEKIEMKYITSVEEIDPMWEEPHY
jgi:hypothetical protein